MTVTHTSGSIPFIEYPQGSKRKSSMTVPGMRLLIPVFYKSYITQHCTLTLL